MAAGTLLPLFWELASTDKRARLGSSHKLVTALQQFQDKFVQDSTKSDETSEEEEVHDKKDDEYEICSQKLDKENATDVSYSIRRLIRGLASPRESSRLGFAVALTELLSRVDTVSCHQILTLVKKESQTSNSMAGQEERDMLFARLFGLKVIIQSGLLTRKSPLRMSSTSASSLEAFSAVLSEILLLGEKKSWLKESCWWTLVDLVNKVYECDTPWKKDACQIIFNRIYVDNTTWGPEKIAITVQLQKIFPDAEWSKYCDNYLKDHDILSPANFSIISRLLKESVSEETTETEHKVHGASPWKPQLHFCWNVILDELLQPGKKLTRFQDFYRLAVDESLFSTTSTPHRKYWGFQVFQSALQRVPPSDLAILFTKNFMRSWINHLSKSDRYLHKIALQIASDLQDIVEKNPKSGFSLVLQLTGTNGSFHFDRVTKTKTIETILSNMDVDGVKEYIDYLLQHFNEEKGDDTSSLESQRTWIVEQMSALLRKGTIPKSEETTKLILSWLATNALFTVKKSPKNTENAALRVVSQPPLSKNLHELCKSKLLACLADLSSTSLPHTKVKEGKVQQTKDDVFIGRPWISSVLEYIAELEGDKKHVSYIQEPETEEVALRQDVRKVIKELKAFSEESESVASSALLLSALLLKSMCDENTDEEVVKDCMEAATKLLGEAKQQKKKKKKQKSKEESKEDEPAPIDLLVDIIIGLLEGSTSFTRTVANDSFAMLTPLMTESTINLILTQLERRDPTKEEEVVDVEESDSNSTNSGSEDEKSGESNEEDSDDDEVDEEASKELRKALSEAIGEGDEGNDDVDTDDASSEANMDDEQMMAIDEKLAEVFRSQQLERKKGKDTGAQREATYFKNRVLDLVDIYLKKQPSNALVLRFLLPLIELITTASDDEKQLSDKAKGILRSRYSKPKEIPTADVAEAAELLKSLHKIARRARSAEIVSIISMCSLYVTKVLSNSGEQAAPTQIYEESIKDYITRKPSSLNAAFFTDFIRRYPTLAWNLRSVILKAAPEAVNGYRQTQAFHIVHSLANQVPQMGTQKADVLSLMRTVSEAVSSTISVACSSDKPPITAAQMKDTLKYTSALCRLSKRLAATDSPISDIWIPEKWSELAVKLSESEHFKTSVSLAKTCQQISQQAQDTSNSKGKPKQKKSTTADENPDKTSKRKNEDIDNDNGSNQEQKLRRPKRKKVRKAHSESA